MQRTIFTHIASLGTSSVKIKLMKEKVIMKWHGDCDRALEIIAANMKKGKVYLIGAGPGDIELMTLKAVRAIGMADVVLIDDLVNREVLDFARGNARVIDVGKRGGPRDTLAVWPGCGSGGQGRIPQAADYALDVRPARGHGPSPFWRSLGDVGRLAMLHWRSAPDGETGRALTSRNRALSEIMGPRARRCKSTPQEFIERRMIAEAKAGLTVARIKGGDPFVFGRGGEEMRALNAAGIEVEVVPGITAGIAAPAALGIPVTHRDFAHGVTLVTGHTKNSEAPNWRALAQSGTTLVIYMGIARLPMIVAELLAAGMPGQTPAAAIQDATLPQQRSVVADLRELPAAVADAGIRSPAIVVIGEVVKQAARRSGASDAFFADLVAPASASG